jgi:hypothetical protein
MLIGETVAVYSDNHTEHINTLCEQNMHFKMLNQMVHVATTKLSITNRFSKENPSLNSNNSIHTTEQVLVSLFK